MTPKSPPRTEPDKIEIKFKKDNDEVYAWAPRYGLTVSGKTEEEALAKMDKALKHIWEQEHRGLQLA